MTADEALAELADRLARAEAELNTLSAGHSDLHEKARLASKADGVSLARSYLRDFQLLVDKQAERPVG